MGDLYKRAELAHARAHAHARDIFQMESQRVTHSSIVTKPREMKDKTHFGIFSKSMAVFASREYRFWGVTWRFRAGRAACDKRLLVE